jgi:hypothetical protein
MWQALDPVNTAWGKQAPLPLAIININLELDLPSAAYLSDLVAHALESNRVMSFQDIRQRRTQSAGQMVVTGAPGPQILRVIIIPSRAQRRR